MKKIHVRSLMKCEYKDCDAHAAYYTKGGTFGTVLHCNFHAVRCVCEGYAVRCEQIARFVDAN